MRLKIAHRTEYRYDKPIRYALQRVRLTPQNGPMQKVIDWGLTVEGAGEELRFQDHFGNDTRLLSVEGEPSAIGVTASGTVETTEKAGVIGPHRGFAPLWLFRAETALTVAGEAVSSLAGAIAEKSGDIGSLHRLMGTIRERVGYEPGTTHAATTAENALAQEKGVCQDHAHIFIAAARRLGYPARYVSGYLMMEGVVQQAASHAWAEAYVDNLGWVAFDPANGVSPDERYVRLAIGRDYRDASPISGFLLGQADERLEVHITVEQ